LHPEAVALLQEALSDDDGTIDLLEDARDLLCVPGSDEVLCPASIADVDDDDDDDEDDDKDKDKDKDKDRTKRTIKGESSLG
jgi:hypothetical protein